MTRIARSLAKHGSSKPPKRITIREVAIAAGVSRSSVSNYLNDRLGQLSASTRERIAATIAALDYRPNRLAQQLKSGKVPVIGLLVPTVVNPHFAELALAIEMTAAKFGYRVLICNTMRDSAREEEFADELVGYGVRRLITVSPLNARKRLTALARVDLSIVGIDAARSDFKFPAVDTVNVDNQAAVGLAVDYLVACGHRNIGYATDQLVTFSRVQRLAGFRAALGRHGLSDSNTIVLDEHETPGIADTAMVEVGRRAARHILDLNPQPTAIVALSDMVALGLLSAFRENGVAVPGMISVIGIDDIPVAGLISPALTTVRQPVAAIAEAAVEKTVARAAGLERPGSDTVFQPELFVRETVRILDR